MFRETVVKGLRTGGEGGKGREGGDEGDEGNDGEDGGDRGGSASNARIEGVACSSTRLGNRLGELKGEASVGDCWKLNEHSGNTVGDNGMVNGLTDGGVTQIVLR